MNKLEEVMALAKLGERAVQIQTEALKMLNAGTPRSGIDHWTAMELFHAVRSLGLLPEGAAK